MNARYDRYNYTFKDKLKQGMLRVVTNRFVFASICLLMIPVFIISLPIYTLCCAVDGFMKSRRDRYQHESTPFEGNASFDGFRIIQHMPSEKDLLLPKIRTSATIKTNPSSQNLAWVEQKEVQKKERSRGCFRSLFHRSPSAPRLQTTPVCTSQSSHPNRGF